MFFEGKRGSGKSMFGEIKTREFYIERDLLEQLLRTTNCDKHRKLWGKELLFPLWVSQSWSEM